MSGSTETGVIPCFADDPDCAAYMALAERWEAEGCRLIDSTWDEVTDARTGEVLFTYSYDGDCGEGSDYDVQCAAYEKRTGQRLAHVDRVADAVVYGTPPGRAALLTELDRRESGTEQTADS